MSETQEEKCRVICEWLGISAAVEDVYNGCRAWVWTLPDGKKQQHAPDFYTSESASALILDAMMVRYFKMRSNGRDGLVDFFEWLLDIWREIYPSYYSANRPDRKTAIAEAALRLIELESRKGDK